MSRRVKDNQLDLVFEGGKLIIPPMIHDRGRVWGLINSMPAQVRDDGVPRVLGGLPGILTTLVFATLSYALLL